MATILEKMQMTIWNPFVYLSQFSITFAPLYFTLTFFPPQKTIAFSFYCFPFLYGLDALIYFLS
jgi:hypothetical protein